VTKEWRPGNFLVHSKAESRAVPMRLRRLRAAPSNTSRR
jgi:hypothetical protein